MKLGRFTKQPRERISKSIHYTDALDPGDSISTIDACYAEPSSDFNDLQVSPVLVDTDRVRIWVQAGRDGEIYKITLKITTAGGEILEDEIFVQVKEI